MGASPASAFAASGPHLVRRGRIRCSVEVSNLNDPPRKVVVIGAGWAGLASAHHLSKQGFDVTVIEAGSSPAEEVGLRGFWSPYHNLFSIVEELGINPFTNWTRTALYTSEGVVVEIPIFQDQTRFPAPLGALVYPQFPHLSLVDRFTSIPLIAAVLDFDGTDIAWRKYDALTARELFKQFCCSERLYREAFQPFVEVGLLAPAEQCSAAAVLSMLYYYVLSHQATPLEPVQHILWIRFWPLTYPIFLAMLQHAGLEMLPYIMNVRLDILMLTALIERWSPMTNTFHMTVGEMTVTLQDVAVILGCLVDGPTLIGPTMIVQVPDGRVGLTIVWSYSELLRFRIRSM